MSPRTGRPIEHGARSELLMERGLPARIAEVRSSVAEERAPAIAIGLPWLTPADELLIRQAARALVVSEALWGYFEKPEALTSSGRCRPALGQYLCLQRTLVRTLSALGLSPRGRAAIAGRLRDRS